MRILVTGGTGFSGKALVKRLIDLDHQVIALDYKTGIKTQEIADWGGKLILGSVTDKAVVTDAVQGVDIVFHLAAAFRELNVPESHYQQVNVEGTALLLESSRQAGVGRFIYCSTCGVHGNVDQPPADETSPIQPADYYQRTKYEAEPLVLAENSESMKTVVLRPAAIYGPGDPERFGMIFRRVKKGIFPIFGSGKVYYHPLYIDNFVDALISTMTAGDGDVFLIADEEYVHIIDLVSRVAAAQGRSVHMPKLPFIPINVLAHIIEGICKPLGISPPLFPRRVDWYIQNRAFSIDKAKLKLDYQPRIGLDEGLRRTATWYEAEGYL